MAEKPKIYFDSCCFIELAKVKIGKQISTDRENDVWNLQKLLEAAENEGVLIYTSTLSLAECTHAEGDVSQEVKDYFTKLLTSGQYVRLVQPTVFIAEDARDLRWKHKVSLSGADAIHVASALDRGCDEYLTWEFAKKQPADKDKIEKLGIKVREPHKTELLPDSYRQTDILNQTKPASTE
jgi:predicted nucleic acid-binding protein